MPDKRETGGRNSQTDTRLSRRNKHAEKNLIRPKKSVWKWHRRNPIFPILTGPKGGLGERQNSACHFQGEGQGGGGVEGWRGRWVTSLSVGGYSSPLSLSTWGGALYRRVFNKLRDWKWINTRHSAFSLSLQKVTNLNNNDTYTYIVELVVIT